MIGARFGRDSLASDPALLDALLNLNNASAIETSWLEAARFEHMVGQAFAALHVAPAQALLLAFDQHADYDSPNFTWFRDRFDRFVYVDRIIVAAAARGQGLARDLYRDLFDLARAAGHDRVTCEVNSDPPNPISDAFHAAMGFVLAGEARLENGKSVRYLERRLV